MLATKMFVDDIFLHFRLIFLVAFDPDDTIISRRFENPRNVHINVLVMVEKRLISLFSRIL